MTIPVESSKNPASIICLILTYPVAKSIALVGVEVGSKNPKDEARPATKERDGATWEKIGTTRLAEAVFDVNSDVSAEIAATYNGEMSANPEVINC